MYIEECSRKKKERWRRSSWRQGFDSGTRAWMCALFLVRTARPALQRRLGHTCTFRKVRSLCIHECTARGASPWGSSAAGAVRGRCPRASDFCIDLLGHARGETSACRLVARSAQCVSTHAQKPSCARWRGSRRLLGQESTQDCCSHTFTLHAGRCSAPAGFKKPRGTYLQGFVDEEGILWPPGAGRRRLSLSLNMRRPILLPGPEAAPGGVRGSRRRERCPRLCRLYPSWRPLSTTRQATPTD